jgi:hypothetical protein
VQHVGPPEALDQTEEAHGRLAAFLALEELLSRFPIA